ncbi:MAG: serine--tRNA ligase, partial [Woeseiaceae bacterium]|nr:serine--tRNA ligase [Woeseiaceae bacterium]
MIDPKLLRQSASEVAANLARRGFDFDVAAWQSLEDLRKAAQIEAEALRAERNASAKRIGAA